MADLQVPVQTDHSHRDEASAAKEESRPTVETAAFPAKQPAVWQARHDEKRLSCHYGGGENMGTEEMGVGGERGQKRKNSYYFSSFYLIFFINTLADIDENGFLWVYSCCLC